MKHFHFETIRCNGVKQLIDGSQILINLSELQRPRCDRTLEWWLRFGVLSQYSQTCHLSFTQRRGIHPIPDYPVDYLLSPINIPSRLYIKTWERAAATLGTSCSRRSGSAAPPLTEKDVQFGSPKRGPWEIVEIIGQFFGGWFCMFARGFSRGYHYMLDFYGFRVSDDISWYKW